MIHVLLGKILYSVFFSLPILICVQNLKQEIFCVKLDVLSKLIFVLRFRYECPDFRALDRTKCHLNGKEYALGEEISTRLPTCTSTCSCDGAEDEFGFSCKFDECAEAKEPPKPECAYQFTIDSCCATNTVCDKAEVDKLPRCWNDGHEFVKGNLIYSPNAPCYKCLCDENFSNETVASQNPNCKPVECGIELHQLSYLQLGCIPVYFDDGLCCPFEFKCRSYHFDFS